MSRAWFRALVLAAMAMPALLVPAKAALKFCNRTSYILYAATGVQYKSDVTTHGWTRLLPGGCASVLSEALTAPAYFAYAKSSAAYPGTAPSWSGQFRLCVKPDDFTLASPASAASCKDAQSSLAPFAPIATGGAQDWTLTFTESPVLDTDQRAREEGLKRLLAEVGVRPAPGSRGLDVALAQFRKAASLPVAASDADTFDRLEAMAKKQATTPPGYSICNTGKGAVWAALGFRAGNDFESQGWWEIDAGHCATAIAQSLSADAVYLFATREGNAHLIAGNDKFCIANAAFDIRGRDNCAARGYSIAGFLATNVKGLSGFAARIGDHGLVQVTPK